MFENMSVMPYELSFFIWIGGIFLIFYFIHKRAQAKQRDKLKRQAMKRGGHVKKGGLFGYPRLVLPARGAKTEIYSTPGGKNTPPHTHVNCRLPNSGKSRLAIRREIRLFGVGVVFGQDIKVNFPEFDSAYVIRGEDEMKVLSFLNPDIQTALLSLKHRNPILDINKGKFQFTITGIPDDEQGYDHLIDSGLKMIEKASGLGY